MSHRACSSDRSGHKPAKFDTSGCSIARGSHKTVWVALLVAPAADLSVLGLLLGTRHLALHGATTTELDHLVTAGRHRYLPFAPSADGANAWTTVW